MSDPLFLRNNAFIKLGIGVQNTDVEKMAGILLGGGKMLSIHCPECKSPLFEKDDKVICSVCNREVIIKKDEAKKQEKPPEKALDSDTENILLKKKEFLLSKLSSETDPKKITDILESMRLILVVLKDIRKR